MIITKDKIAPTRPKKKFLKLLIKLYFQFNIRIFLLSVKKFNSFYRISSKLKMDNNWKMHHRSKALSLLLLASAEPNNTQMSEEPQKNHILLVFKLFST